MLRILCKLNYCNNMPSSRSSEPPKARRAAPKWVQRFDTWVGPNPVKPGVWHRRDGGYVVRGRPVDPRTGKLREIRRVLKYATAVEAYNFLQEEIRKIKVGSSAGQ